MSNLQYLQAAFKRYLFEQDDSISTHIIGTEKLHKSDRLAIYANAYRARLAEALENDYPALKYLLGEDDFRILSLSYIKSFPSRYYSLRWFGKNLPRFLANHEDYRTLAYLAELAELEWTFIDAFDAKDSDLCGIDDAAKIPTESWPNLRLQLHPSVSLITCSWNCLSIWQSMKKESELAHPQALNTEVNYLIWRQGLNTSYRSLKPDEAGALTAVKNGADFGELCTALTDWMESEETALRAATLFKTWLADGLVSHLTFE